MRRVFVCSPYRGNVARNVDVAQAICRKIALAGDAPLAPHLHYPGFLHDDDEVERATGIAASITWLAVADLVLVVGEPTEGMKREIAAARSLGLPIEHVPARDG